MSYPAWRDPTWYSDADVRSSLELQEMAIEYVETHSDSSFAPLVEARQWLEEAEEGDELPITMIRKVVNTMRHDSEVNRRMPVPSRFGNSGEIEPVNEPCDKKYPHYGPHAWLKEPVRAGRGRRMQKRTCPGVSWPINRIDRITMKVNLNQKYQFVRARTGRMIHKVSTWDYPAYAWWWPEIHRWGFRKSPMLRVRTACKNPSIINDPILLTARQKSNMVRRKEDPTPLCPYCAEA